MGIQVFAKTGRSGDNQNSNEFVMRQYTLPRQQHSQCCSVMSSFRYSSLPCNHGTPHTFMTYLYHCQQHLDTIVNIVFLKFVTKT